MWLTGNVFFFSAPVFLILIGILVYKTSFLFGPMRPQKATPFQILLWSAVRPMEKESDETIEQVLDRIEETLGRSSGKMTEIEVNSTVKNVVKHNLEKHLQALEEYQLTGSTFFGSNQTITIPHEETSSTTPLPEQNIKYLCKCWYVRTMNRYNAAEEKQKPEILREIVEDLKWWQRFYENVYYSCDLRPPSLINMLKEMEMAFDYFRESSSPQEYEQMIVFREKLKVAFITQEAKKQINQLNKFLGPLFKSNHQ